VYHLESGASARPALPLPFLPSSVLPAQRRGTGRRGTRRALAGRGECYPAFYPSVSFGFQLGRAPQPLEDVHVGLCPSVPGESEPATYTLCDQARRFAGDPTGSPGGGEIENRVRYRRTSFRALSVLVGVVAMTRLSAATSPTRLVREG
jgi:hypothetical protein